MWARGAIAAGTEVTAGRRLAGRNFREKRGWQVQRLLTVIGMRGDASSYRPN